MIGSRIGQYRVLRLLGEGGMGRVLLVEHAVIGSKHALKMLHPELSSNGMIVQRFLNEARAASAIGHRNVIEISHVDQVEGDGPWYLVMKYLEGQTLAAQGLLRDQRAILHIASEALNGLQAAHDRRIIHRDLKPDNLFLTTAKGDPRRVVVLDFGVAQLGQDARVVTRSGAVLGTPQYMAAEQHRGAAIDHRTDIFAMGAIVYEMLTGRLPYEDDASQRTALTGAEIFHRMMTRPVPDPRQVNPAITEGFARAVMTALATDPRLRHASARDFALRLAEATPASADGPSGFEILRQHADELLEPVAPVAPPLPVAVPTPRFEPPPTLVAEPIGAARPPPAQHGSMSTLGASASQVSAHPRSPRGTVRLLAIGIAVAITAGAVTLLVLRRPPPRVAHVDARLLTPAVDAPPMLAAAPIEPVAPPPAAPPDAAPPPDALLPTDAAVPSEPPRKPIVLPAPTGTGRISIAVLPWAEVWIDGKAYGQTPLRVALPAGSHRVRLKNDAQEKTVTVTVSNGKTTTIDESW